jgi:hypothetical protein
MGLSRTHIVQAGDRILTQIGILLAMVQLRMFSLARVRHPVLFWSHVMEVQHLQSLFVDQLRDLYSAEKQP